MNGEGVCECVVCKHVCMDMGNPPCSGRADQPSVTALIAYVMPTVQ